MVTQTYHPRTREERQKDCCKFEVTLEFQATQGYIARHQLKKKKLMTPTMQNVPMKILSQSFWNFKSKLAMHAFLGET